MKELKTGPQFLVKNTSSTREVTGIFSTFGVRDSMDDITHPGSMVESFKRRGNTILFLWSHQYEGTTTGFITEIKEIPRDQVPAEMLRQFPETTGGAVVTRRYLTSPAGENAYQAAINSPIQMSWGYNVETFDLSRLPDGTTIRNLRKVDVLEVSDCLWGANANTASNIAGKKGYRFAGNLPRKAGARHSASDRDALDRMHADIVALGATCGSGKRSPELARLGAKLTRLQLGTLGDGLIDVELADLRAQARRLRHA